MSIEAVPPQTRLEMPSRSKLASIKEKKYLKIIKFVTESPPYFI